MSEEVEPPSGVHGSGEYRRQMAGVVTKRALLAAIRRARRHEGEASG
ncbi:MAG: hypothetical protein ACRDG9_03280 [Actinomycetota bacterium]